MKCFYAGDEVGLGSPSDSSLPCADVEQTITDVGVCNTFHASSDITVFRGK